MSIAGIGFHKYSEVSKRYIEATRGHHDQSRRLLIAQGLNFRVSGFWWPSNPNPKTLNPKP